MSGGHGYTRQPKETLLHGMMQNNNCSYMCFDTQFPSHQKAPLLQPRVIVESLQNFKTISKLVIVGGS